MINPFNQQSPLRPFRWYLLVSVLFIATLVYANLSGWRIFGSGAQQQWNASGPGYHK